MWSLFKKKPGEEKEDSKGIFVFAEDEVKEHEGEELNPLKFSNGKTQEDVVKEVLSEIEKGAKIIFIRGSCGTGKSAIALNLARHFKKTAIVVPIKSLQEQYEKDYSKSKFILKKDKKKLKICVIKGRNNFRCPFNGERCDDAELPCTIDIKEKNMAQIKSYIEMNENVSKYDFSSVSDVRRMSIAPACEFWSPLLPAAVNIRALEKARKNIYQSASGEDYAIFQRKKGCPYYDQYQGYVDSDVLIFNSLKYLLETAMQRKPKTQIDIIDECDEFLDNFAQEKKINLNRLLAALMNLNPEDSEDRVAVKDIIKDVNSLIYDYEDKGIEKIEKTGFANLLKKIDKHPGLAADEEDNYYNSVLEIARSFIGLLDGTYVSVSKSGKIGQKTLTGLFSQPESVYVTLVTINLQKQFQNLLDNSNILVLMSGTLHSERVLKDIFGLKDFKIIDAETSLPGVVTKYRTGLEKNCKYENFKNKLVTRKSYLEALSLCVENAKKPALVHVNSFEDLPSELEKVEFQLNNLISRERLKEIQDKDKQNLEIERFKRGETDILFTTKCSRGVDFPGEQCNSIILTKYPYPNIQSLFWQILKKEKPDKFMEFYLDKANRELLQKIYRGVRFKGDYVVLLSPDSRVLDANFK